MKKFLLLWVCSVFLSACAQLGREDAGSFPMEPIHPTLRPQQLVDELAPSSLRDKLQSCREGPFYQTPFSIAHRGAPAGYPEHTREGYEAAAAMGAGIIECDVTFTKDLALVCRHSQCDLHRTTNILQTPLASQCSTPFSPATASTPASAKCCTSDISLAEFKTLCGRRDLVDSQAHNVAEYLKPVSSTYAPQAIQCGTLLTHRESIEVLDHFDVDFTPELKGAMVSMPYAGMNQQQYASRMLAEYTDLGIDPQRVHPQTFNLDDVRFWLRAHPDFAAQAIYLDPRGRQPDFVATLEGMLALRRQGVTTIAPPIPMLLVRNAEGGLEPSAYARFAKQAGLDIVTWTLESGDVTDPNNWMYASLDGFMHNEAQMLEVLHALATEVGIKGIFSDWPGTVTYYANCMGK